MKSTLLALFLVCLSWVPAQAQQTTPAATVSPDDMAQRYITRLRDCPDDLYNPDEAVETIEHYLAKASAVRIRATELQRIKRSCFETKARLALKYFNTAQADPKARLLWGRTLRYRAAQAEVPLTAIGTSEGTVEAGERAAHKLLAQQALAELVNFTTYPMTIADRLRREARSAGIPLARLVPPQKLEQLLLKNYQALVKQVLASGQKPKHKLNDIQRYVEESGFSFVQLGVTDSMRANLFRQEVQGQY
jgi:hypothetical protein